MQVDTSLNAVNAGFYNVVITSDLQNVAWTNVSSTIQVTGNSIQKVSGTNLWDAGAVSSQTITAGDGYMEFTPGETATWRMCGLGNTDSSAYYGDIEYAFFVAGGGTLQIYESGNLRGSFGTYAAGDRLKVAVEGGVVKYYRNGTLVYTSTVAPPYPLQVDTSLNTVNAGVYNVVISGTRLTASPINYMLQDVQGSTRAVMSGTGIVARHDFLPFGEEIGAGTGMRTGGQGFGVPDKIRQRYAMTERDDATGLDHTWWRKYEHFSGRWTSPDPYLGSMSIANPQSFNRYSYVQNDPVNFVDPSGTDDVPTGPCPLPGSCPVDVPISWDDPLNDPSFTGSFGSDSTGMRTELLGEVDGGGGGGGGGGPLDTKPADLRDRVQDIGSNCADFLNQFFDALGSNVYSHDLGTLFDRIRRIEISQKPFNNISIPAVGHSSGGGNNREIYVKPSPESAALNQQFRWNAIAQTVVQELLHHSRNKGLFSDPALDRAALSLMNPADQASARAQVRKKGYIAGTVGHRLVNKNCKSTNPTGPPPRR